MAAAVISEVPEPGQRDFRNVSEWHTHAVRAREAYFARKAGEAADRICIVDVTPEGGQLLAEVRGLPGATYADTLAQLRQHVREVIILSAEPPDDAEPEFTFRYQWPEPGDAATEADSELFDDPFELVSLVEGGLPVDTCRLARSSGLI